MTITKLSSQLIFTLGIATLSLSLSSCSTFQKGAPADLTPGEGMVPGFSDLAIQANESKDLETIVILGTNDIHGQLAPLSFKTREADGKSPIPYEAGGALALSGLISAMQREFSTHLLWLDAGDEFQGTIESNSQKGAPMVQFFNLAKLQAAAIGNHEFDYGPLTVNNPDRLSTLKARMSEAKYPYLSANIFEKKTKARPAFPNTYPSILTQVGKLKVGLIGLSTLDTPTTTFPINVRDLDFTDLKIATLREAALLRLQGAQVIVVTIHAGLHCGAGRTTPYYALRKPTDPMGECGAQDEVVHWLKSLPSGTVDAVVSGHSHTLVHHFVPQGTKGDTVPVIQGGASTRYVNLIYLTYDLKKGKLLTPETRIEGPIPVCSKVFQNQGDCNGERPSPKQGRGPLVDPLFHGKSLEPDPVVTEFLKPVFSQSAEIKSKVISYAATPIEHDRMRESAMADVVADAMRDYAQTDFAFMNSGGVRSSLEAGPITYGDVFRVSPFDNSVVKLKVTGKELKNILRTLENGARGFHSVSGLVLRLIGPNYDAPSSDLNGDGKIEPWEINRLIDAKTSDGDVIRDDKMYTLATLDFLVLGGDDMGWAMAQIPKDRIDMGSGTILRDILAEYLKKGSGAATTASSWNSKEHPILEPGHPRLIFENPDTKKKKSTRKTKHSRRK